MDQHADVEKAVRRRYSAGARTPEPALCCPTSYDPALLAAIPEEVLARDYGCGDPEISLHIDTTMRGRRDGYARATTEAELDGLRAEFAELIRSARRRTGRCLEAASTVTVTRRNLPEVSGIVRWFLGNADAFKMDGELPARGGRRSYGSGARRRR